MKAYILARLSEPSTWRGVVLLIAGITGSTLPDIQVNQYVTTGLMLAGLIGAVSPNKV